jgi:hypothetical protein
VGKPEGKIPLGIPRHRWEGNNKWALEKCDGVVWTGFIWLTRALVSTVMNIRVP